jgi:hypothetical protein
MSRKVLHHNKDASKVRVTSSIVREVVQTNDDSHLRKVNTSCYSYDAPPNRIQYRMSRAIKILNIRLACANGICVCNEWSLYKPQSENIWITYVLFVSCLVQRSRLPLVRSLI